jgi:hypothetical protein
LSVPAGSVVLSFVTLPTASKVGACSKSTALSLSRLNLRSVGKPAAPSTPL